MIKYANNILLATQISMMNEIANLSNEVGRIDVMQVVRRYFGQEVVSGTRWKAN